MARSYTQERREIVMKLIHWSRSTFILSRLRPAFGWRCMYIVKVSFSPLELVHLGFWLFRSPSQHLRCTVQLPLWIFITPPHCGYTIHDFEISCSLFLSLIMWVGSDMGPVALEVWLQSHNMRILKPKQRGGRVINNFHLRL